MAAIPFRQDFDVKYGTAEPLSPLVTRVFADNPGPFTYTGTGVFIIGTDEAAIIDPGPITPAHMDALDKALKGKTLTHILLTHHHADHSPMAAPLAAKYGAKVYGYSGKIGKTDKNAPKLEAGQDMSFNPDIEIETGHVIQGKDWTLEAIHTPGHTSNHMCYALKQENTLFSGDHIMGWSTSVVIPPDGHMGDYLRSLKIIKQRDFDIIRPTHGPHISETAPFVQAYIDHRYAREDQIGEALSEGINNISDMVVKMYADIDKRLHPAAAYSVWSHLIHMCETGRIFCVGKPTLNSKYSLI